MLYLADGLTVLSVPERTSSLKILLSVNNCCHCTISAPAVDYRRCTSCSGLSYEGCGPDGNGILSWLHPEPLSAGIGLAFGCIGHGFREPVQSEDEDRV